MMCISLIIPVINEAKNLRHTLPLLHARSSPDSIREIIVVDGGSTDNSIQVAKELGARVIRASRGRARQMNAGAAAATGEILYFLHADTLPPEGFDLAILKACGPAQESFTAGCFRMRFDWKHPVLTFFAWWTRIDHPVCRGGDQSLFVPKSWFTSLGGYNEDYQVYEDNEFIRRLGKAFPFVILKSTVVTSARKYRKIGVWRLQYHFARIHLLFYSGKSPERLFAYYSKNIASRSGKGRVEVQTKETQNLNEISPSS